MTEENNPNIAGEAMENAVHEESAPSTGDESTENSQGGLQKRFNKLTKQRRDAQLEAAYYKGQLEAMKLNQQPQKVEPIKAESVKPNRDDFQDYDQYVEALTEFKADAKAKDAVAQMMKQRQEAEAQAQKLESQKKIASTLDQARTKYNDFDEIALADDHAVNQNMIDAAQGEQFGDVLYYLGQNHSESQRIASLSREMAFKEIAKIEAKLSTQPKQTKTKETTQAPPPVTTLGGKSTATHTSTRDMTVNQRMQEWEKQRLAKLGVSL